MDSFLFSIKIKAYLFFQEMLVIKRYYKNLRFALLDLVQKIIYGFVNPYRTSRKYLEGKNSPKIHMYGETPISLFDHLLKQSKLTEDDVFFELGCGRGRLCLFAKCFYRCSVVGVEQIPIFVKILKFLKRLGNFQNFEVLEEDMLRSNLSKATFIYLYGTCLNDHEIEKLLYNFQSISTNSKILTVSFVLSEYDHSYEIIETFDVKFPWGSTNAYLQVKKML